MTERGTTGAGRPQIAGVPRVHRFRELDGRGTTGDDIRHGQTRVGYNRIRQLKPPAMIHGSMVANGTKSSPHWTKSWLAWRLAWTPAKAKPKNRSMSRAGDSRTDQMSLRQQLRRKESMSATTERCHAYGDSSSWCLVPLPQRQPGAYCCPSGGGPQGK